MAEGKGLSLVTLSPQNEITFTGPFTDVVTSYLKIQNTNAKTVCFKVKTTAPKQYCVRPNSGIVKPGESATVAVMLQPIEAIPVDAAKHKFMVQSCYAASDSVDIDTFWKEVNPSELHYAKLRVMFETGKGGSIGRPSPPVGAGDAESSFERVNSSVSSRSPSYAGSTASAATGADADKMRKIEGEVERLQRERAELLLKVQAANSKAAQAASDFPIPMIQVILIVFAGLLIGLIVGKLF